jgi:hypothetical protein
MNEPARSTFFPLPLTAFESYLLADDRCDFPMTFPVHVELSGVIDRSAFEGALGQALKRHPLLSARVERSARRGERWSVDRDWNPTVDWQADGTSWELPGGERIDLAREPGLRLGVRLGVGRARLIALFHHACCDGIGALRFIGDLLASYSHRVPGEDRAPALRALHEERLAVRDILARPDPLGWKTADWVRVCLRETFKNFVWQRPVPLQSSSPARGAAPGSGRSPRLLVHTLDERDTILLRTAAQRQATPLNNVLVRDLFHTLRAWGEQVRPGNPKRWLRVMIPVDLRGNGDAGLPAANVISYIFLNRRARDCSHENSQSLLDSLRVETGRERVQQLGRIFLAGIAAARAGHTLPLVLARRQCFATAILTNVGNPTGRFTTPLQHRFGLAHAGNLVLERITGTPPLRSQTNAVFGVLFYARRLTLCLRADPSVFSQEEAARLLGLYVDSLRETARAVGPTGQSPRGPEDLSAEQTA